MSLSSVLISFSLYLPTLSNTSLLKAAWKSDVTYLGFEELCLFLYGAIPAPNLEVSAIRTVLDIPPLLFVITGLGPPHTYSPASNFSTFFLMKSLGISLCASTLRRASPL